MASKQSFLTYSILPLCNQKTCKFLPTFRLIDSEPSLASDPDYMTNYVFDFISSKFSIVQPHFARIFDDADALSKLLDSVESKSNYLQVLYLLFIAAVCESATDQENLFFVSAKQLDVDTQTKIKNLLDHPLQEIKSSQKLSPEFISVNGLSTNELSERLQQCEDECKSLRESLAQSRDERNKCEMDIFSLKQKLNDANSTLESKTAEIDHLVQLQKRSQDMADELHALQSLTVPELQQENLALQSTVKKLEADKKSSETAARKLDSDNYTMKLRLDTAECQLKSVQNTHSEAQSYMSDAMHSLQAKLKAEEQKVRSLEHDTEQHQIEMQALLDTISRLREKDLSAQTCFDTSGECLADALMEDQESRLRVSRSRCDTKSAVHFSHTLCADSCVWFTQEWYPESNSKIFCTCKQEREQRLCELEEQWSRAQAVLRVDGTVQTDPVPSNEAALEQERRSLSFELVRLHEQLKTAYDERDQSVSHAVLTPQITLRYILTARQQRHFVPGTG
ncbi:cingulin-like 1 [Cichlidogyrus casuarinus]|uniref:Cingulin-like 1 n=1 Tax=Cichlidogyrus casuarinus TaxID=1844966 RepID=A0ABD2PZ86_9PLAT